MIEVTGADSDGGNDNIVADEDKNYGDGCDADSCSNDEGGRNADKDFENASTDGGRDFDGGTVF